MLEQLNEYARMSENARAVEPRTTSYAHGQTLERRKHKRTTGTRCAELEPPPRVNHESATRPQLEQHKRPAPGNNWNRPRPLHL